MTWGELKTRLQEAGVEDSDEIDYVDVGCGTPEHMTIVRHLVDGEMHVRVTE